ncbi:hypothetical protein J3U11_11250 [Gilliamella sp. B2840]|uniref:hypothetical protein n=1 Tax=unclassified Gilliamella TaxID=2685620 RepID=UPI00226A1B8A|nr:MULTISPECIES: hypothetical protein [unclassified Gilliamella]MCX8665981.1 hypothetical protein [Gilliamella sp. B2887]MCX8696560.1 hypothetical protein [Gilliamella sp. B2828]MCX8698305.1 hypothetical protein [Gilliamella sp. B3000]MCX8701650.1 hypothetical protein [Gilliamella sp. B2840]
MTTNYIKAQDEMCSTFKSAWSNSVSILGYEPDIGWKNKAKKTKTLTDKFFCLFSTQTTVEKQATLSGYNGIKRYRSQGIIIIQIFCPKNEINSDLKGKQLAILTRNAFRKNGCNVWYRNARINELNQEELFYRFNIIVEYEYDEII